MGMHRHQSLILCKPYVDILKQRPPIKSFRRKLPISVIPAKAGIHRGQR